MVNMERIQTFHYTEPYKIPMPWLFSRSHIATTKRGHNCNCGTIIGNHTTMTGKQPNKKGTIHEQLAGMSAFSMKIFKNCRSMLTPTQHQRKRNLRFSQGNYIVKAKSTTSRT